MSAAKTTLAIFQEESKGRSRNSTNDVCHLGNVVLNENSIHNFLADIENHYQNHG